MFANDNGNRFLDLVYGKCLCFFLAYPRETKSGTKFNVFTFSTNKIASSNFLIKMFKSGDNFQKPVCNVLSGRIRHFC